MTPTQAKRAMLLPRQTRAYRDCPITTHYYVENEGITVVDPLGKACVRLSWKQIDQAIALKRLAASASGESYDK